MRGVERLNNDNYMPVVVVEGARLAGQSLQHGIPHIVRASTLYRSTFPLLAAWSGFGGRLKGEFGIVITLIRVYVKNEERRNLRDDD